MFNIYREIRRQNLTMQKVAPITARESRREETDLRLTARPIKTSTPSDGKTNATKNQFFPYRQHKTERRIFINSHGTPKSHLNHGKKRPKLVTTTIARLCTAVIKTKKPPNISKKPHQPRRNSRRRTQKRQNNTIGITQKKPSHSKKQQNRSNRSRKHNNYVKRSENNRNFV